MKKTLVICNGIALVITIAVNYLSNTGMLNGNTMKTISDRYANYFTPAGYAFSIWGLIYAGLLAFVIYTATTLSKQGKETAPLPQIKWWFVISCLANSLWVVTWLYGHIGLSVLVMAVIFFSLVKIILNTGAALGSHPFKTHLFIFAPFSLYLGWISVAFIANTAAYLTSIEWSGWGISPITWTLIMIAAAGLVNIFTVWARSLFLFGAVGIWALLAIAASNDTSSIISSCYIVSAIILLVMIVCLLKNIKQAKTQHASNHQA